MIPSKLTKCSVIIFIICLSMINARPRNFQDLLSNEKTEAECAKMRSLKKNMSDYLHEKLKHLTSEQQEYLAKKLISRLHKHFKTGRHKVESNGPWTNNGEMFARML